MNDIFIFLIFPGFLFTLLAGMTASWFDRKITARVQWRVGPPWYQSFADTMKLLYKEVVIPRGCSYGAFIMSPFIGFAAVILVASIMGMVNINPDKGFVGDIIVVVYLLIVPSLALMMGGAASGNPLASLGAAREMKLIVAYELPFILAVITPVIKAGLKIKLGELVALQHLHGAFLWSPSCILAFVVAVLCMQAKLAYVPFDIAEAETEINGGPMIEYSGPLLAVLRLTRMMSLVVVPFFILTVFSGGLSFWGSGLLASVIKYVALLLIVIVIKNTNPRLRIDQALKFFWGPVTVLAAAGVVLALFGY
jgi:NADH-quinone oxidoreductase subunit H